MSPDLSSLQTGAASQQDKTGVMSHGAASPQRKREIVAPRKKAQIL
jgi:hypothetical protein